MTDRDFYIVGGVLIVPLTHGRVAYADADDLDLLAPYTWLTYTGVKEYAIANRRGRRTGFVRMHRLIHATPDGVVTDHRNGNSLDNRRWNLRSASIGQNARNSRRHVDNSSGFKGVSFCRGTNRWRAQVMHQGKRHHLGRFDTPEAAHAAYVAAAAELHGEFHRPT